MNQQEFSEAVFAGPQKYEKREAIYFNEYYWILFSKNHFIFENIQTGFGETTGILSNFGNEIMTYTESYQSTIENYI